MKEEWIRRKVQNRGKGKQVVKKGMSGKRSPGHTFDSSVPLQILLLFCQSVSVRFRCVYAVVTRPSSICMCMLHA